MNKDHLEPGLLHMFRIYILVRAGVIMLGGAAYVLLFRLDIIKPKLIPYVVLFLADIIFLLVFLFWSWPRHRLGRAYLPIALAIATGGPILEARYLFNAYTTEDTARFWLVFPFLSVPLILIAWQYRLPQVLIYCYGTALAETTLVWLSPRLDLLTRFSETGMIAARTVFFVLVGYIVSNLIAAQREQRQALAEANRQLVRYAATLEQLAVSRERNRLARELHDTLAHTLSGLAVQLDALASVWDPLPPRAATLLDHALTMTRAGLDETRRALQALRATPLEDLGLTLALRGLAESVAARCAFTLHLELPEQLTGLTPEVEQAFYRVAQEALENIARHANARQVTLTLRSADGKLILEIHDDGRGFVPEAAVNAGRLGLQGMRERAALIGGTLELESSPGGGTTVRLTLAV